MGIFAVLSYGLLQWSMLVADFFFVHFLKFGYHRWKFLSGGLTQALKALKALFGFEGV